MMFRLSAIALLVFLASTFGPSQVGNAVRVTAIEKELSLRFLSLMRSVQCPRSILCAISTWIGFPLRRSFFVRTCVNKIEAIYEKCR